MFIYIFVRIVLLLASVRHIFFVKSYLKTIFFIYTKKKKLDATSVLLKTHNYNDAIKHISLFQCDKIKHIILSPF